MRYQVKLLGGSWDKVCSIGEYYLFLDDKLIMSDDWGISSAYCPANDKKNKVFTLADTTQNIDTSSLSYGEHRINLLVLATDITDSEFYENIANSWDNCEIKISSFDDRYRVVPCDRVNIAATDTYRFNVGKVGIFDRFIMLIKSLFGI